MSPPGGAVKNTGVDVFLSPVLVIELPDWVASIATPGRRYAGDQEKMGLAVRLSRENVERGTGGPFAAAIFERDSGVLVAVGMNSVVRLNNCALHGEMVAFMMAQHRLASFTLGAPGMPVHELFTSCAPCAMCLGAILWSGVRRVVCGASRDDATILGFEEGPVFAESWRYLEERGIECVHDVLRAEARAVLELYRAKSGTLYNG